MAIDNGHCSTCQNWNSKANCGPNAQNFFSSKLIGDDLVSSNEEYLKLKFNDSENSTLQIQPNDIIDKEKWDQIATTLQYIRDYGEMGTRNPTQTEIDLIKARENDIILFEDYNNILKALDNDTINFISTSISKDFIDLIKTKIINYHIDNDRCNVCNTAGCQVSQCCDNDISPCVYYCQGGCQGSCQNVNVCPECSSGSESY